MSFESDSKLGSKIPRNRLGVFVEGDSLQYWASKTLGKEFSADDIVRIVQRFGGNRENIQYYMEARDENDQLVADRLKSDGLQVDVTDLMTSLARAYRQKSEEALRRQASEALPNIDHLIVISGRAFEVLQYLFSHARQLDVRTTLLSFSHRMKKTIILNVDHFHTLERVWADLKGENMVTKTVVELDLVGYSEKASTLEEQFDAALVAQFNEHIQEFVDRGLAAVGSERKDTVMATTGDGAILTFDRADDAHRFAVEVHNATQKHNAQKKQASAKKVV